MSEALQVRFETTAKQGAALTVLRDTTTRELLFGGGAGGGKSYLGCYWVVSQCLKFDGVQYFIGRNRQVDLYDTTFATFKTICGMLGLQEKIHYSIHFKPTWRVKFFNDSQVYFRDLFYKPTDPEFQSLGSLELTGAFIDEAGEITEKARNVLLSRIRHNTLTKYRLIPKLLMTTNPVKGFIYRDYFDADRSGEILRHRKFIQSLLGDNRHITDSYREVLESLDKSSKERLLFGNWDFSDDPADLIEYAKINDLFTNTFVKEGRENYMTADIAAYGADKFVLMVWKGWVVTHVYTMEKADPKDVEKFIRDMSLKHRVPMSNIAYDSDGLGTYLRGYLKNAYPFVNGGKPIGQTRRNQEKYKNLKSQCYFHLARQIVDNQVFVAADMDLRDVEHLKEELSQVKNASFGTDKPLAVLPKDKIKVLLGRSPDFSDCMMMRSVFDVRAKKRYAGRSN